jgi:hypothetical protein
VYLEEALPRSVRSSIAALDRGSKRFAAGPRRGNICSQIERSFFSAMWAMAERSNCATDSGRRCSPLDQRSSAPPG